MQYQPLALLKVEKHADSFQTGPTAVINVCGGKHDPAGEKRSGHVLSSGAPSGTRGLGAGSHVASMVARFITCSQLLLAWCYRLKCSEDLG